MSDLILFHPVNTQDNKLLLPSGTKISSDIINDLILASGNVSYKKYSLLKHGSIRKEILGFISIPPYNIIFSDKEVIDDLLNFMGNEHLISPVIQSLDYFRENDFYT
jgi:hypothetical protein